jgi:cell wall assembly regulator SMI1
MSKLSDDWRRLSQWAADCPLKIEFNPGAGADEIAAAEAKLGLAFPADLREYLELANGEAWNSEGFIGGWQLLDLENMVMETQTMRELAEKGTFGDNRNDPTPAVKGLWWNPQWIPIVSSGSGHFLCLDLDPGPEGTAGQVILFLHDDTRRFRVAPGLKAWFARLAEDLEGGLYEIVSDGDGTRHFNSHALMWSSLEGREVYGPPPGK